jgi:hypothetical protein
VPQLSPQSSTIIVADRGNSQKLVDAFPEVFMRGWHFAQAKYMSQPSESV